MPAELTTMSMRPDLVSVSSRAASTVLQSATFTGNAKQSLPRLAAFSAASSASMSQITIRAPPARNVSATAPPIPCAPPVMTAVCCEKSLMLRPTLAEYIDTHPDSKFPEIQQNPAIP